MVSISEEEPKNLSSQVLPLGLLMVHDASRGDQHHLSKLSGGQQVVRPLLNVVDGNVEPGRDDATLVKPAGEVNHNLASAMVINPLKLSNVAVLHHHSEETDDRLGAGPEHTLTPAPLLGIVDAAQGICQRIHPHHGGSRYLLSLKKCYQAI